MLCTESEGGFLIIGGRGPYGANDYGYTKGMAERLKIQGNVSWIGAG